MEYPLQVNLIVWDNWIWYFIIISSGLIGILLIILLFMCCQKRKQKPPPKPIRPSITNTVYEPINVRDNKILVDEIENKKRIVNNTTYEIVDAASEEENVEGFGETDSIEYIEVTDNVNPTGPINTNFNISKPRRRKSETTNEKVEI